MTGRTFLGYRRADVLGRDIGELIVPPHLRERHAVGFARYLAHGESHIIGRRIEIEAARESGDVFPVELTVTEVRLSPDLKHATCFVEPLGGARAAEVTAGLNRCAKFLRGRLGHAIELRFTPDLKFVHDESFEAAAKMNLLLAEPRVRRDVEGG